MYMPLVSTLLVHATLLTLKNKYGALKKTVAADTQNGKAEKIYSMSFPHPNRLFGKFVRNAKSTNTGINVFCFFCRKCVMKTHNYVHSDFTHSLIRPTQTLQDFNHNLL
jgi:hypothetical protein